MLLSGLAAVASAASVSGGLVRSPSGASGASEAASLSSAVPTLTAAELVRREQGEASRSDSRDAQDPAKTRELSADGARAKTVTDDASQGDPRDIAKVLLTRFGWGQDQFGCLDSLWTRESNWRVNADNPSSSAYGIPQALPGSKMSAAGSDWATNPVTQITWGLGYIRERYGSPCAAWGHSEAQGFY